MAFMVVHEMNNDSLITTSICSVSASSRTASEVSESQNSLLESWDSHIDSAIIRIESFLLRGHDYLFQLDQGNEWIDLKTYKTVIHKLVGWSNEIKQ